MARHVQHTPVLSSTGLSSEGLYAYPSISQAATAGTVVAAAYRGEPVEQLKQAKWIVFGYGKSVIDGEAKVHVAPDVEGLPPDTAGAKLKIADHLDDLKANGVHAAGKLPWAEINSHLAADLIS